MTVTSNVKGISFEHLAYIEFSASKEDALIKINHRRFDGFSKDIHQNQLIGIANALWEPVLGLVCTLTGFEQKHIIPSRWEIADYGVEATRRFNAPKWTGLRWKHISGMIHLRDSFLSERSIDNNFIDLFLMLSSDPYGMDYSPIENDDVALKMLVKMTTELEARLTEIAQVVIEDESVTVACSPIVWEKDCVPVWGGDGYWLKGIIQ